MSISLYDASVGTYLQILSSVEGVLDKGREHCEANGIDLDEVVETRLIATCLPSFQLTRGAPFARRIKGVEAGVFGPPTMNELDYGGLRDMVAAAREGLGDYSADTVNGFAGKDMEFRIGSRALPFVAQDFLLTFSLPNFYFHAATAYDILRMKGTQIGKMDFLGRMRMKG